ncbi:GNAT family N-acetyltransferase [Aromatoleum bremense]|uniref:GNAT family N-acetyltransferase n=1 Tax=Aromatoleum bremense TaxID=76115 RepID=A0ABX1NZF3_9RHOO|nr:GNAT family N-acetyltransferase [Aromatoleum bremense]NMG17367.1 GNAT family N-acetyltransferase [Aromatoleum bremense]QTQ33050.1 Acyl-CoA N-acyltransferase [Aromatoleum bremense]
MPEKNRVMRVLKKDDLGAVVAIDEIGAKRSRRDYYERKFETILNSAHNINSSIVCEIDGRMVGFVMGDVYFGEFGIPETSATIDTIGVHPEFQNHGIASEMLDQFMMNMKAAGVKKVYTLVNWDDFALEKFFSRQKFTPSKLVNLEYQLP